MRFFMSEDALYALEIKQHECLVTLAFETEKGFKLSEYPIRTFVPDFLETATREWVNQGFREVTGLVQDGYFVQNYGVEIDLDFETVSDKAGYWF